MNDCIGDCCSTAVAERPAGSERPSILLIDDGLERHLRKLGVDEYFTKPVRFDDLCYAVRRFIDLRERAPAR